MSKEVGMHRILRKYLSLEATLDAVAVALGSDDFGKMPVINDKGHLILISSVFRDFGIDLAGFARFFNRQLKKGEFRGRFKVGLDKTARLTYDSGMERLVCKDFVLYGESLLYAAAHFIR